MARTKNADREKAMEELRGLIKRTVALWKEQKVREAGEKAKRQKKE